MGSHADSLAPEVTSGTSFLPGPEFFRRLFRQRFLTEKLHMNGLRNYTATGNALKLNLADSGRPEGYGPSKRPRRLARPRTPPFHGDNTGSNPVGDANKIKDLAEISCFRRGAVWGAVELYPGDSRRFPDRTISTIFAVLPEGLRAILRP